MTQVPVKLNDQEWRQASEELAKLELRKKSTENMLDEEADEWKDRKKDLKKSIDQLGEQIQKLALEVETRQRMVEAQQELTMEPGEEETTTPPPESSSEPSEEKPEESEPAEREPGEDG